MSGLKLLYVERGTPDRMRGRSEIIAEACVEAGTTLEEVMGGVRTREVSYRRFHVAAILRARQWSFPDIARRMGYKEHTAVLHAVRRWNQIQAAGGTNDQV